MLGNRRIPGTIGVMTPRLMLKPDILKAELLQKADCDRMLFLGLVHSSSI
jgi:hypothetical protein